MLEVDFDATDELIRLNYRKLALVGSFFFVDLVYHILFMELSHTLDSLHFQEISRTKL